MMALDDKGKVYVWGHRQALIGKPVHDRFGMKSDFENLGVDQLHPREVNQVIDYYTCTKISCGKFHNMVLTNKNEVYVWGENEDGQLGLPQLNDQEVKSSVIPKKLEFADPVVDIDCG